MRDKLVRILSVICIATVLFSVMSYGQTLAAPKVNLSLRFDRDTAGSGDLLTIECVADNMPDIKQFGPIDVKFNHSLVSYTSLDMGPRLKDFVYNTVDNEGSITVNASHILPVENDEDYSEKSTFFFSDDEVVLFSLNVSVMQSATGPVDFSIDSFGSFVNKDDKEVNVSVTGGTSVDINISVSSDATIAFLRLNGVSLTPEFSKNVTRYEATVDRSVTEVAVNVTPSNMLSNVNVEGNKDLKVGRNEIFIDVTAQDGTTKIRYTIIVTRKEKVIPDNAHLEGNDDTIYFFEELPKDEFALPEGFNEGTGNINGFTVPVFSMDGVSSVLLYLKDEDDNTGFYFYNPSTGTILPFNPDKTVIRSSRILTITSLPSSVFPPQGFEKATYQYYGQELEGYSNDDNEFICYMKDDTGTSSFYLFDKSDGLFYRYKAPDKTKETAYRILFAIFFGVTICESVVIVVIVFIVRKVILDKTNPRPKRV